MGVFKWLDRWLSSLAPVVTISECTNCGIVTDPENDACPECGEEVLTQVYQQWDHVF